MIATKKDVVYNNNFAKVILYSRPACNPKVGEGPEGNKQYTVYAIAAVVLRNHKEPFWEGHVLDVDQFLSTEIRRSRFLKRKKSMNVLKALPSKHDRVRELVLQAIAIAVDLKSQYEADLKALSSAKQDGRAYIAGMQEAGLLVDDWINGSGIVPDPHKTDDDESCDEFYDDDYTSDDEFGYGLSEEPRAKYLLMPQNPSNAATTSSS